MQQDRCEACGTQSRLTWHHVLPRCLGGGDQADNLVRVCQTCHAAIHDPGALRGRDRNARLLKRHRRPVIAQLRRRIHEARLQRLQNT